MSKAISGVGTKFRRWDKDAKDWVNIAEITNITGPDKTRGTINVTSLDSLDGYQEFIAGMRDGGTVGLSMNYTRDGYDLMNGDFEDDALQNYEILLPDVDETSLEFQGLVTTVPLTIPYDDRISMEVEIKVSKKVFVNSGSGSGHSF